MAKKFNLQLMDFLTAEGIPLYELATSDEVMRSTEDLVLVWEITFGNQL